MSEQEEGQNLPAYPFSDSYLDERKRRRAGRLPDTRGPLKPLPANITKSGKTVLVWTASGPKQHHRMPAVYSYKIVNQRLSHIAAFAPPRAAAGPRANIAYRFVFTNAI